MALEAPPVVATRPLGTSLVHFAQMSSLRDDHGMLPTPVDDAFLLTVEMMALPAVNVWVNGRHQLKSAQPVGNFTLVNLNVETVLEMNMPFDSVELYIPRSVLNSVAAEQGIPEITALDVDFLTSTEDPVVCSLAHCLLPAFASPERASRLFMDHVAMAALSHLTQNYAGFPVPRRVARGGLAPWQAKRAKDILSAHICGDISIEELAGQCGLSRSHFARAFRKSTGKPPHRWLMELRLARARDLLVNSTLSLGEIAERCGFVDQSHFTRSFSAAMGVVPSAWRRLRRS
ncbi:MAG: AraC family transcriptional regulator [Rhizomicrobium sp.]